VVFGAADSVAGGTVVGKLAVGAGQMSVALMGLSYSREQERQADRVGTYYMALAGWDPREAISMQRLLASLSKDRSSVLDRYLSTHPESGNRVAEIEDVIEEKGLGGGRYVQGDGVFAERWQRRLRRLREVDKAFGPCDRGRKLLEEGKASEALAAAEESLAMRTDQAPFHILKGDALYVLKQPEKARKAYEAALKVDPRYVPANVGLGLVEFSEGRNAEAERQFAIAAHGFPSDAIAWYGLGASRYRLQKYADALPALEKVEPTFLKDADVHYMLAVCYDRTGKYGKAHASYARALEAGLGGPEAQQARARLRALQPYALSPL
jgi:predicted Zn-dependent protease